MHQPVSPHIKKFFFISKVFPKEAETYDKFFLKYKAKAGGKLVKIHFVAYNDKS